jgi:hypothetical protein
MPAPTCHAGPSQSREQYLTNRAALVSLAGTIVAKGGAYDFQTDWEYITRVAQWDEWPPRWRSAGSTSSRGWRGSTGIASW